MDLYNTISACQAATVGTETVQIRTHTHTPRQRTERFRETNSKYLIGLSTDKYVPQKTHYHLHTPTYKKYHAKNEPALTEIKCHTDSVTLPPSVT